MAMPKIFLIVGLLLTIASPTFAKKNRKPAGPMVAWKDLPVVVQTTLRNNTSGGKVKEVEKVTAANGAVIYCAEVKGSDGKWVKIYVNEPGVLVKTEPDNARNKRKHKPLFGD